MDGMRNIDVATATVNVVHLNNTVVSMRIPMKKAKVHVIHKLTTQIKKYKNKKGKDSQLEANKRKGDRLIKEIEIIKKLNIDRALKFALANEQTVADVASQDNLETKAMVRLACHKNIQDKVQKWRQEHSDWKSLSAYLLQHISRRLKKKKKKQAKLQAVISQDASEKPVTDDDRNLRTRKTKKNESINKLLQDVQEADGSDSGLNSNSDSEQSDSDIDSESENIVSKDSHGSNSDNSEVGTLLSQKVKLKAGHAGIKSVTELKVQSELNKAVQKTKNLNSDRETESKVSTQDKGKTVKDKSVGELVVQKINLNDLEDDIESLPIEEKDVSFLFQDVGTSVSEHKHQAQDSDDPSDSTESNEIQTKRKSRDNFFLMDSESDELNSSLSEESSPVPSAEEWSEDDAGQDKLEFARKSMMIESTFIGSLNTKKPRGGKLKLKDRLSKKSTSKPFSQHPGGKIPQKGHQKWNNRDTNKKNSPQLKRDKKYHQHGKDSNVPKSKYQKQNLFNLSETAHQQKMKTKTKAAQDTKIHPSWEASMKRRQEQSSIQNFQGKKIKFDDDD